MSCVYDFGGIVPVRSRLGEGDFILNNPVCWLRTKWWIQRRFDVACQWMPSLSELVGEFMPKPRGINIRGSKNATASTRPIPSRVGSKEPKAQRPQSTGHEPQSTKATPFARRPPQIQTTTTNYYSLILCML